MRILFVADGRSPIALSWIGYFLDSEHEIHLASTYPCDPDPRLASYRSVPVAFSQLAAGSKAGPPRLRSAAGVRVRTLLRQWLGLLSLPSAAPRLKDIYNQLQPDLVHAMRIPYEGILAAMADPSAPLLVSVWGNDFTLHAASNPWLGRYTRLSLARTNALHADCRRDVRLAHAWGLDKRASTVVLPGAGGVQRQLFYPPSDADRAINEQNPLVVNPRGIRSYVRNDTFFKSVPIVLSRQPGVRFACPVMAGEPEAEKWVENLSLAGSVELLPRQSWPQMAELFRRSLVAVSPSEHDGTPNTLLEAMACGCFPVAGDIESLREWVVPGESGLLIDPGDPEALARAVITALENNDLRRQAFDYNQQLIAERAEYQMVMARAENFYRLLLGE